MFGRTKKLYAHVILVPNPQIRKSFMTHPTLFFTLSSYTRRVQA